MDDKGIILKHMKSKHGDKSQLYKLFQEIYPFLESLKQKKLRRNKKGEGIRKAILPPKKKVRL